MICSVLLFLESIGTGELLVILLFVLFFFGSKKIPELARGLGKGMREMNDAVRGIKEEINNPSNLEEEKKLMDGIREDIKESIKIEESEDSIKR